MCHTKRQETITLKQSGHILHTQLQGPMTRNHPDTDTHNYRDFDLTDIIPTPHPSTYLVVRPANKVDEVVEEMGDDCMMLAVSWSQR
jgi:hypothetical protein